MAVQEFNPNNVMLSEKKDGTFTPQMTNAIMADVANNSVVMQLGTYEEMNGQQEKKFQVQTDGISAYWVDEGQKIQTSKPEFVEATMRAKKLGVIILASREYLTYTFARFFEEMKPYMAEALYKKIDEAAILDKDNPFAFSVEKSATDATHVVDGALDYANILALEDFIYDANNEVTGFITNPRNHSLLRTGGVNPDNKLETLYDRNSRLIDGLPTVDLKSMDKGTIYAGDWKYMRYGTPYNMTFKISEEGTLSTIKNSDGSDVNLFEQELIALRVTMDFAFMTVKDDAFAKLATKEL